MEFSLDDKRAGAGSSILLSPEVVAIRAKLIETHFNFAMMSLNLYN